MTSEMQFSDVVDRPADEIMTLDEPVYKTIVCATNKGAAQQTSNAGACVRAVARFEKHPPQAAAGHPALPIVGKPARLGPVGPALYLSHPRRVCTWRLTTTHAKALVATRGNPTQAALHRGARRTGCARLCGGVCLCLGRRHPRLAQRRPSRRQNVCSRTPAHAPHESKSTAHTHAQTARSSKPSA